MFRNDVFIFEGRIFGKLVDDLSFPSVFHQERDIDRTVGINTGHVGTSDFVLEQDDRDFVVEVCF